MKRTKRALSLLLAVVMAFSLLMPGSALEETLPASARNATGTLSATLRFDYPQRVQAVENRKLQVKLLAEDGMSLGEIDLQGGKESELYSVRATVSARSRDGAPMTNEPELGYYDLTLSKLPLGSYMLEFSGVGYRTYRTSVITLAQFSQHVIVGTGDGTFTLGDLDGNGKVENADRDLLSASLGNTEAAALTRFDLNGDAKIDIIDLAYVNHNVDMVGGEVLYSTALIAAAAVDLAQLEDAVTLTGGSAQDLFQGGTDVTIAPKTAGDTLNLPIELPVAVEMDEIQIISSVGTGAIEEGTALITLEDGTTESFPFSSTMPVEIYAIGHTVGANTITINLGHRIPVKSITITVNKVTGSDGVPAYAVVNEIKFLKDIVPENPVAANSQVKNIAAIADNEMVTLKWSELPNVTGYEVRYGLSADKCDQVLPVEVPVAVVKGLENLVPYFFTVTPISDGWRGISSELISATPQPSEIPSAPNFLNVTELDGALRLAWGKAENATAYHVFYRADKTSAYLQIPGDLTALSYTIPNLTNGTAYELCVTALNSIGESGKSIPITGTPFKAALEEPVGIPEGRMDRSNIESVVLPNNNVDNTQYPNGFNIINVVDGDYATHWSSQHYGSGNWSLDKEVQVTFKTPMTMSNIIWVPRLDGTYRNNLKSYFISVWDSKGTKTELTNNRWIQGSKATGIAILPIPTTSDIKKISIRIGQEAYTSVSLSELIFFNYDLERDLDTRVQNIFTDGTFTALKSDVTAETVAALKTAVNDPEQTKYCFSSANTLKDEVALAESLLSATPKLGVVLHGIQSRDGSAPGNNGQGGSLLQPLGVVAKSGDEISIYAAGIPEGKTVSIVASQFNAEASTWQQSIAHVTNGRNILIIPKIGNQSSQRGGSLYLTYSGENPEGITLQVRRATDIPVLELSDCDPTDIAACKAVIGAYVDELTAYMALYGKQLTTPQTQVLNSTELSMPHVLLSIPADIALRNITPTGVTRAQQIDTLYHNLLAWEQIMYISCTTQGMDTNADMQTRQNIRYMQMFAGAFMYAAGSHIGVGYGSCGGLVGGKPVDENTAAAGANKLFGWGIAHEIGHNMDVLGKAEITNNIYSIMVQTYDGAENTLPSRLELSDKYAAIFTKTATGYPGASNDVFTQLGMYWQLHLAYDDGANPLAFYNAFFQIWKADTTTHPSYDDRVALTAAKAAGMLTGTAGVNLTEFFTRWGMLLADGTKTTLAGYSKESRALWYLDDQSRRYRLSNSAAGSGAVENALATLTGENGTQVALTFTCTAGDDTIQGYEILRNGVSVGFTRGNHYTDLVGSANNRTFAYTVKAYDKLGNLIGQADANEVRVSYDKSISSSAYKLDRAADGTITVTFSAEKTAVSGIKVLPAEGTTLAGAFTVAVKAEKADQMFTVAKTGNFSSGNQAADSTQYLTYFNKPGANASDTRIWTYDTAVMTITGVPTDAQVQLISYAGDNVAFRSGATMGLLGADYTYDENGSPKTIEKGTMIIVGEYRGDPLYGLLQLSGAFYSTTIGNEAGDPIVTGPTVRPISGETLLFAEVPEDGEVSNISDGFFLFVPDLKWESDLQGISPQNHKACSYISALPAQLKAELYRTDTPGSEAGKRLTSNTLWIDVPSADSLPQIFLTDTEVQK